MSIDQDTPTSRAPSQVARVRDRETNDREANRLSARVGRYARVGGGIGGVALKIAGTRLLGGKVDRTKNAEDFRAVLGNLKGPLMKIAQLISTVPDALPPEYAEELAKLQAAAPPMGWAFVKRRMAAELGHAWQRRFTDFEHTPRAAASLGQVHRATGRDGRTLACKLQYPDMQSTVEADLAQMQVLLAMHRRMSPPIDATEMAREVADRVREELDYAREAKHMKLYGRIFVEDDAIRVPEVVTELSSRRLLTMTWLEGLPMLTFKDADLETRNRLATAMFRAWWHPFGRYGVIHGDPHLGNYTVFMDETKTPAGINLLDFGCVRIFPPRFVASVVDLYFGLLHDNRDRIASAYERWGFVDLSNELIDVLNIWARFIYGPLLSNRVRTLADGVKPSEYGRREVFQVYKALKEKGPVRVPREFVFMDRAAIGLGSVFLHLRAELNFYELFHEEIDGLTETGVQATQRKALDGAGLD